jgi:hypothetical protein
MVRYLVVAVGLVVFVSGCAEQSNSNPAVDPGATSASVPVSASVSASVTSSASLAPPSSLPASSTSDIDSDSDASDDPNPPCGSWMADSTALTHAVHHKYGEVDDCVAIGGAWVIDTDTGETNHGWVGIEVCSPSCAQDIPTALSSWTWYQPAKTGNERVGGTNKDGTIMFLGGAGELAYNIKTKTFSPEIQHSP